MLWDKIDSLVIRNFHDYWEDPLINKYLGEEASKHYEGVLILRKSKKPIWISHPFNYKQAKKQFSRRVIVKKYETLEELKEIIKKETGKLVGYNPRHQTVVSFKNLTKFLKGKKLIDAEEELEKEREIKTPVEITKINKAARETLKALNIIQKWIHKGVTEKEVEEKIRTIFRQDGYETAFCIVAFEENSSHIHHATSDKKLNTGVVLIDVGAKYKGYSADLTRTFWCGEKKGKKYVEFNIENNKVLNCLNDIEKTLKEGVHAEKLWKCTKTIGELPHSLGHGIGIEVHDFPSGIGHKSKWILKAGMVLAIEPAIYKKTFGIRQENTYLITKKGYKIL
ncbi:MAG: Xaa-Pro peptidase family protein [archaeon]|jgi:Xaa-Pro aminopeptidase